MRGLALEGGGAKGAYQIGAHLALDKDYDYSELCAIVKEKPLPNENKTAVDLLIDEIIINA